MAKPTEESPDGLELRAKPKISARLSKRAVMVAGAAVIGVLLFITANVSKPPPSQVKKEPTGNAIGSVVPALSSAQSLNKDVPDQPMLLPAEPPPMKDGAKGPKGDGSVPAIGGEAPPPAALPPMPPQQPMAPPPPPPSQQEQISAAARQQAAYAESALGAFAQQNVAGAAPPGGPVAEPAAEAPPSNRALNEKEQFLQNAARSKGSAVEIVTLNPPINEFEIKTGTVINGIMISFANSDLPGDIIAQVSQNVYDTASGQHLLIPQGTKLFGKYDSNVSFGQERLVVAWTRLIFPNGSAMDLGGIAGYDQEGAAGYKDKVNNHYIRTFAFGLLTSIFSAAFQVSQPQQQQSVLGLATTPLTNQQIAAAAVGQQMTQLGIAIAQRNLNVQPTIEIRKGYKFLVMVNKDLVFPGAYRP